MIQQAQRKYYGWPMGICKRRARYITNSEESIESICVILGAYNEIRDIMLAMVAIEFHLLHG